MKKIFLGLALITSAKAFSETVFKIEIGDNNKKKVNVTDLQERVWDLERAVAQLQGKVFDLETAPQPKLAASWICSVEAMGENHTGTGATKAEASQAAISACRAERGGDTFFCKNPKCEQ
jgi:hypothetical protein